MGEPDAFEDLAANLPPAWQAWPAGPLTIVIALLTKKT